MQTRSEASPPAPPSVTGSEVGKGAVNSGENRVSRVWIHSPSQLINEALGALLTRAGCEGGEVLARADSQADANIAIADIAIADIAIADIAIADIAVWDLRSLEPPYPRPPDLPTLALIGQGDAAKEGALQAGYRGYLSGEETADEVGRALEAVLRGEVWAERRVLSRLVTKPELPPLTAREAQVLPLVLKGLSNKGVAKRLGLAEKTVKVYVSELLYKLEAKNRAELILRHERERCFGVRPEPTQPVSTRARQRHF